MTLMVLMVLMIRIALLKNEKLSNGSEILYYFIPV